MIPVIRTENYITLAKLSRVELVWLCGLWWAGRVRGSGLVVWTAVGWAGAGERAALRRTERVRRRSELELHKPAPFITRSAAPPGHH